MKKKILVLFLILFLNAFTPVFSKGVLTLNPLQFFHSGAIKEILIASDLVFNIDADRGLAFKNPGQHFDTAWTGGAIFATLDYLPGNQGTQQDTLSCTPINSNITTSYNRSLQLLTITANSTASISDIQSTLRTLKFSTSCSGNEDRIVRIWVVPSYVIFFHELGDTRLFGMIFESLTGAALMTYTQARQDIANSPTRFGLRPYLASIAKTGHVNAYVRLRTLSTDSDDQQFIGAFKTGSGATALWYWDPESPEAGKAFWKGGKTASGGANYTLDGLNFSNWVSGQPDNGSEPAVAITSAGAWHDYPSSALERYVVSYGMRSDDANYIRIKFIKHNALKFGHPF